MCGDEGLLACAASLFIDASHECWLIATAAQERRAWDLGINTTERVTPRLRVRLIRDGTIAALKRLRDARASWEPELIQCWSLDAMHLARRVFGCGPGAPARCAVVLRPPGIGGGGGVGGAQRSAPADSDLATGREVLVAMDGPTRAAIAPLISRAGAIEAARWLATIRLVDPPCFAQGGPVAIDRAALRTSLGIQQGETVVSTLADPPSLGDANRMAFASGMAMATGHRTISLIRRGAKGDRRAVRYVRSHGHRWGLVVANLSLPEMLACSDMTVIDAPDGVPSCGPVAASLALSMAVPIVAFPGVLPGWPVLHGPSMSVGRLAVPIAQILESSQTRVEMAALARSWCDHARASKGFHGTLAAIWREQLNVPVSSVDVPHVVR